MLKFLPKNKKTLTTLLMTLGLLGLLPGIVVNGHLWWAIMPGGESFGWSSFPLGDIQNPSLELVWRIVFIALAGAIIWLWPRSENRSLPILFALPLILAAFHPSSHMGAMMDYTKTYDAEKLVQSEPDKNLVDSLQARQTQFYGIVDWLPPWIANTDWVASKYDLALAAQKARVGYEGALTRQIRSIEARVKEFTERRRRGYLASTTEIRNMSNLAKRADGLRRQLKRAALKDLTLKNAAKSVVVNYVASHDTHRSWISNKEEQLLMIPYGVFSALAILLFLFRVGIWNKYFGAVCLIWIVGSAISTFGVWGNTPLLWAFASLYPVAASILICISLRFLMRIWADNKDIYKRLPATKRKVFWRRSIVLVIPFVLASFGLVVLGNQIANVAWNKIYCDEANTSNCINLLDIAIYNSDLDRNTRRDDVHIALDVALVRFEAELNNAAGSAKNGSEKSIIDAANNARNAFGKVFKPDIWNYESVEGPGECIYWIGINIRQCAYNMMIHGFNGAYQEQKNRLYSWYNGKITFIEDNSLKAVDTAGTSFKSGVSGLSAPFAREAKKYVDFSLLAGAAWELIGLAIILMVCGRAFVTIQGRLYIQARPRDVLSVVPPGLMDMGSGGKISASKNGKLEISAATAKDLFVKRGFDLDNASTTTLFLPSFPRHFVVNRILSRTYWLKGIRPTSATKKIGFSISENRQFIRVNLAKDSVVAFRWKDFVASSNSISFKRLVTLRMSFAVFGHLMRPVASGPGTLILRTRGNPVISTSKTETPSVEPYRVVTMTLGSCFRIHSGEESRAIYFDEVAMTPAADANVALDVADESKRSTGIIRQLIRLILP